MINKIRSRINDIINADWFTAVTLGCFIFVVFIVNTFFMWLLFFDYFYQAFFASFTFVAVTVIIFFIATKIMDGMNSALYIFDHYSRAYWHHTILKVPGYVITDWWLENGKGFFYRDNEHFYFSNKETAILAMLTHGGDSD